MADADYKIQGYEFNLIPRTKANIDEIHEIIEENEKKRGKIVEFLEDLADSGEITDISGDEAEKKAKEELGYSSVKGDWEIRREIFRTVLDGPHDQIDIEQVTWDTLEEVRTDFLPPQMRYLDALEGF